MSPAQNLLGDLTEIQFNWHPSLGQWSIAECIDHLIVSGRDSLSNLYRAINDARSKGLLSQGPFRYGLIQEWFVRQMGPSPRMKFKAPKYISHHGISLILKSPQASITLQEEFL